MTRAEFRKSLGWVAALLFVWFLNGHVIYRWAVTDTKPLAWDESIHTRATFEYIDRLKEGEIATFLNPTHFNYPPLYHLSLAVAIGVTGSIQNAGAFINFFYLGLLILAVFLIGDRLLGRWPAFTAAVLVSCYPLIAEMARPPMIDLALTAWVALSIYFLLLSENFSKKVPSIFFGVSFAAAMLTKWSAFMYVGGPLVMGLFYGWREKNLKNIGIALGAAALLMAPWMILNLVPMLSRLTHVSKLPSASGVSYGTFFDWFWYFFALPKQLNLLFFLLFLPGLGILVWRPKLTPIFVWFVGSLVLFTLVENRNIRYSMPALPAAALLSVAWLPVERRWSYYGVLGLCAWFFTYYHYLPARFGSFSLGSYTVPLVDVRIPDRHDWKHEAIIKRIRELKPVNKTFARVVTVSNHAHFHSTTMNITLRQFGVKDFAFRGPSKRRWLDFAEFIVVKTGKLGPKFTLGTIEKWATFVKNPPRWFTRVYKEDSRWPLPDGTEAVLYVVKPDPVRGIPDTVFNLDLDEFKLPRIVARDVKIRAEAISPEKTQMGELRLLTLQAAELTYKKFRFTDVSLKLTHPQVNLHRFLETGEIQLIRLGRLIPQATLSVESLFAYAARKAKWLKNPSIDVADDRLTVKGKAYGIPIYLSAEVKREDDHLKTKLHTLRVLGIPLPLIFVQALTNRSVPLVPYRETPFYLDIGGIAGTGANVTLRSI